MNNTTEQLVAEAMRYAVSQLPGAEEILLIKAENAKLKEENKVDDLSKKLKEEAKGLQDEEIKSLRRKVAELEEENKKYADVSNKLGETIRELLPNDPYEADKYIDIAYGDEQEEETKVDDLSKKFEGYLEVEYDSDNEEHSHKCDKCPNNAPDDQQSCGKCR